MRGGEGELVLDGAATTLVSGAGIGNNSERKQGNSSIKQQCVAALDFTSRE